MQPKIQIYIIMIKELKSYLVITFGLFIFAFAWTAFLIPSHITAGGISGVGTLIYFATGFPVAYSYLIINGILVAIALQILGRGFGAKTVYAIVITSLFFYFLQKFITEPLVPEKFMATVVGAILNGAGVGVAISQGGSTGGTDIIALIINKYKNISPGRIILYIDVLIISSSYLIFKELNQLVYGFVVMGITAYVIDLILTGSKQSMQLFIFSQKHEEIAEAIVNSVGRGVSVIDSKGWYTKEHNTILMVVIRKPESPIVFKLIKEIDNDAFVSVGSVMGVYGHGFEEIKV